MITALAISNPKINILSVVLGIGMAFYLSIEPTPQWLLPLMAAVAAFGTDAILRDYVPDEPGDVTETTVYLPLPILTVVITGVSLEHIMGGVVALPVAVVLAPAFGGILYMLCASLEITTEEAQTARVLLNAATYLVAFAFYALAYEFQLGVVASAFVIGLASALLTSESIRDAERDIYRLATYGGVVGYVMAQMRWALNFTPLDGMLGAAFLLTTFYVITGLLQHYFSGRLSVESTGEFAATALIALVVILIARVLA